MSGSEEEKSDDAPIRAIISQYYYNQLTGLGCKVFLHLSLVQIIHVSPFHSKQEFRVKHKD